MIKQKKKMKAGKIIRIYGMEQMLLENTEREQKESISYFARMCDVDRQEGDANKAVSSIYYA